LKITKKVVDFLSIILYNFIIEIHKKNLTGGQRMKGRRMDILDAKVFVSKEVASIRTAGFGHMEDVLRTALFTCVSDTDWRDKIIPALLKSHPELGVRE
jgi:hypothetical protein